MVVVVEGQEGGIAWLCICICLMPKSVCAASSAVSLEVQEIGGDRGGKAEGCESCERGETADVARVGTAPAGTAFLGGVDCLLRVTIVS